MRLKERKILFNELHGHKDHNIIVKNTGVLPSNMPIEAPTDDCVGQPQQDKTMTSRKEREAGTTNTAFPEHTMRWILAKTVSLGKKMSK